MKTLYNVKSILKHVGDCFRPTRDKAGLLIFYLQNQKK